MPRRMVWPVSRSVSRCSEGSARTILPSAVPNFSCSALVLAFDRHADDRVGEAHALEHHRVGRIAQRVAGLGFGQRDQRDDVAGAGLFDGIGFLGEHLDHAADLLALAARGIHDRRALGQHARVNADEGERTIGVVDDLERQRRERFVVRALALADRIAVGIHGLDRRHVGGRRQIIDDGVQHLLHALVLVRGAAQHRREGRIQRALAQARCAARRPTARCRRRDRPPWPRRPARGRCRPARCGTSARRRGSRGRSAR